MINPILTFKSKAAVKSNKDYEKEKRAEQEDFEKKIGLLTYLGQSVSKNKGMLHILNYCYLIVTKDFK